MISSENDQSTFEKNNSLIHELKQKINILFKLKKDLTTNVDNFTMPKDLAHPTLQTNFSYISKCDVDAITLLYGGGKSYHVAYGI